MNDRTGLRTGPLKRTTETVFEAVIEACPPQPPTGGNSVMFGKGETA